MLIYMAGVHEKQDDMKSVSEYVDMYAMCFDEYDNIIIME